MQHEQAEYVTCFRHYVCPGQTYMALNGTKVSLSDGLSGGLQTPRMLWPTRAQRERRVGPAASTSSAAQTIGSCGSLGTRTTGAALQAAAIRTCVEGCHRDPHADQRCAGYLLWSVWQYFCSVYVCSASFPMTALNAMTAHICFRSIRHVQVTIKQLPCTFHGMHPWIDDWTWHWTLGSSAAA